MSIYLGRLSRLQQARDIRPFYSELDAAGQIRGIDEILETFASQSANPLARAFTPLRAASYAESSCGMSKSVSRRRPSKALRRWVLRSAARAAWSAWKNTAAAPSFVKEPMASIR